MSIKSKSIQRVRSRVFETGITIALKPSWLTGVGSAIELCH